MSIRQASPDARKAPGRRSKYGAIPRVVDGHRFASTRESVRYAELKLLEKAGEIRGLELQPRFPLRAGGPESQWIGVGEYVADFRYEERRRAGRWLVVIEDVKGFKTPLYRLKKRLAEACHAVTIREIR